MDDKNFQLIIFSCFFILFTGFVFGFFQGGKRPQNKTVRQEATAQSQVASSNAEIADPETEIILTGDVMLGRTVTTKSLDEESDPRYPFLGVAEELNSADLTFINLENPIIEDCPRHTTGFKFCAPPEMVEGLLYAGVDVVTVANNHSRNYGEEGFWETIGVLNENGVDVVGDGNLSVRIVNGLRFGFLGFNFLETVPQKEDYLFVENSKELVDVLIVGVHWGAEYQPIASEHQERWARELVGNGADVVVGHHPHWVQNIDCFIKKEEGVDSNSRGVNRNSSPGWTRFAPRDGRCPSGSRVVYYSLGNFVFDQMWSEKTREGLVVRLTFKGTTLQGEEFLPIFMNEWARPEWVE